MLVASRALAAARPALISLLITTGAQLSSAVPHPISFCNVLFIGNLCAALTVGAWFGFGHIMASLRKLPMRVLFGLFLNGCLATLLSTLIFLGLAETTVTNAVLLGRLGPVLFAVGGAILLKKKVAAMEWFGFGLIVVGVIAIALRTSQYQINRGDIFILLSTIAFAASSLTNQLMVGKAAPVSVVVFSRNFVSAACFFVIALRIFGPGHFGDAFSGPLWLMMSVYALVVIVMAQFLWYKAVNQLDSRVVGRLTVLSPIFGVTYGFILNGERPSSIQMLTLLLVIAGVVISALGRSQRTAVQKESGGPPVDNVASAS